MRYICLYPTPVYERETIHHGWSNTGLCIQVGECVEEIFRVDGYVYCDDDSKQKVRICEVQFESRFQPRSEAVLSPTGIPLVKKK